MRIPPLIPGRFVRRDNRFRATVTVNGTTAWAHVPNSGRLTELFTPGRAVWLAPVDASHRRTSYDLKLVEFASVLVSVDARLPNPLFEEALAGKGLPDFPHSRIEREVNVGGSRLDFRLTGNQGICWVETKSVTLVEEGVALFPDAPTSRGRRHLRELACARESGDQAAVVFVIQRTDANCFRPHHSADPEFSDALRQAADLGVAVRAFTCEVTTGDITLAREIPVNLPKRGVVDGRSSIG
jgi:sugar fermentation stimulation protein A